MAQNLVTNPDGSTSLTGYAGGSSGGFRFFDPNDPTDETLRQQYVNLNQQIQGLTTNGFANPGALGQIAQLASGWNSANPDRQLSIPQTSNPGVNTPLAGATFGQSGTNNPIATQFGNTPTPPVVGGTSTGTSSMPTQTASNVNTAPTSQKIKPLSYGLLKTSYGIH